MGRPTAIGKPAYSCRQAGFTLLGLLFLVAGLGVAMAAVGTFWHTAVQREKELDLLFIGNEYRRAIESFWEVPLPVGTPRRLPKDFNELLSDPRFPNTVRHLRRLYRDPMTGGTEWGLVREPDGTFSGVYSLSQETPMKQAGFDLNDSDFQGRQHYSDWVFAFKPSQPSQPSPKPQAPRIRVPGSLK
jgi:type II secretory pathway pseudopilin PulG